MLFQRNISYKNAGGPSIMNYNANAESLVFTLRELEGSAVTYKSGDILFKAGDRPDNILLVRNGSLRLDLRDGHSGFDMDKLLFLQSRKIWGLQEALLKKVFKWTAFAMEPVEGKLIQEKVFLDHIKQNPLLRFKILTLLSKESKALTPQYE